MIQKKKLDEKFSNQQKMMVIRDLVYNQILNVSHKINKSIENNELPSSVDLDSRERLIKELSKLQLTENQISNICLTQIELEKKMEDFKTANLNQMREFFLKAEHIKKY
jgi:uncharacterized membrane protein YjgN (DUF898 family)